MSKQQMAQTSACFECNASLGDYKKTFPITLTLTPYELTFTPKESSIFPTSIPYCCIYGYNAPNKSALESSVQDSSQDQLFTLHYVKFTSPDLRAVSSPKLARMYLLFDQSDIKRFLALTEQLGDTEYGKHAVDIAHKVDLKELDTLIVISGDGVLHEIINGLLTRPDWDQARHLPIGIIPAGSGNAIATSIGTRNPIVATLAVIRGEASKLDIFSLSQLDRPRIYSMLMFSWGMMADADIESDKYRWLGSLRFDIAGLVRMVRLRRYPGKVYVLPPRHKNPVQQDTSQQSSPAIQYGSLLENTHEEPPSPWRLLPNMPFYSLLVLLNCPSAGETVFFTDTIRFNDGIMRLWYSCETRIRKIFFPFVLDMTNGKLVDRGLMQDTECGGLLIVPGIEGKPDDPSTFNIVDRESVLSESAKRLNIHQRPGVFDVDGEVMPTARTLIEILPSFMNIIVPEWHYHEQDLEGEREKEGGDGREKAAEGKHKTLLVVEA
ncbi:hypothetical protein BGX21_001208, partial [Mortierella sp. AD011]